MARMRCAHRHSESFRQQAAASTETDAEFLDPFDYAQAGFARNERIK
jgi:hypothetical protein